MEGRDEEADGLMQPSWDWLSKPLEITGRTRASPSCPGGMGNWEAHLGASEVAGPKKLALPTSELSQRFSFPSNLCFSLQLLVCKKTTL